VASPKIIPTLQKAAHPLASGERQRECLDTLRLGRSFDEAVAAAGHVPLRSRGIDVLQMNVGKRCNQTCRHCHVDAGPDRQEVMSSEVIEACFRLLEHTTIPIVDITGGAPELHPRFREIVERARSLDRHVIDRCNLTIVGVPAYADLPELLAMNGVEVVASLPSYVQRGTDAQRGDGVFEDSVHALRRFNAVGYGKDGTGLILNLVTNPVGEYLPGNQRALDREWHRELKRRYGVEFNRLYAITNMPIGRFLEFLIESGNLSAYMERLVDAFNPAAVDGLMCRTMLSVGWDGRLYDCDFNQMLELGLGPGLPRTVFEATPEALATRVIQIGAHCFGCTAGAGSSCSGATA
jgi:radical SAM/Cys-rich protein